MRDEEQNVSDRSDMESIEEEKPSYWTLPRRGQILVLVIARICEPLSYASITPYIYYMVRDFGYSDPSEIAELVTITTTFFSFGQALTAVWWGTFSDSFGRKPALLLGLIGTGISTVIFGTAQNIWVAIFARMLSGMLNGNIGVMRTMVAEFVGDKKQYQTRAFAILPITMNVGTVVGPMIGGLLADPAENYPKWFGDSKFLLKYPYILPNLFPLPFIVLALSCCVLFLEETLVSPTALLPPCKDLGLKLGNKVKRRWNGHAHVTSESAGLLSDVESIDVPLSPVPSRESTPGHSRQHSREPSQQDFENPALLTAREKLKRVLTKPVLITLSTYVILMLHCPTFMQLFPLFLSTPRIDMDNRTFWRFNGGLGLATSEIGLVVSIIGAIGVSLQLMVYPRVAAFLGNARLHKTALLIFPLVYFLIPFLSFVPENPRYLGILASTPAAAFAVLGRTFAIPPMVLLITNATPNKKYLGTVHGLTHSITSVARTVGPFLLGNIYSLGVKVNMIQLAWWTMAAIATGQIFVAMHLKEWGVEEIMEVPDQHARNEPSRVLVEEGELIEELEEEPSKPPGV